MIRTTIQCSLSQQSVLLRLYMPATCIYAHCACVRECLCRAFSSCGILNLRLASTLLSSMHVRKKDCDLFALPPSLPLWFPFLATFFTFNFIFSTGCNSNGKKINKKVSVYVCCSLAFNLCRPVGVMRLLLLLCSVVVVIVIVVFSFYYSHCSFSNSVLFHFFFLTVICFSSVFFVVLSLTNVDHPLWIWPITPVHAHYKLFPSKTRTNEWTKNHRSKSMNCTAILL